MLINKIIFLITFLKKIKKKKEMLKPLNFYMLVYTAPVLNLMVYVAINPFPARSVTQFGFNVRVYVMFFARGVVVWYM